MGKKTVGILSFLGVLVILTIGLSSASWAAGEKYPTGTISNICLFPPGVQPDLFNRILLDFLTAVDAGRWPRRQAQPQGG